MKESYERFGVVKQRPLSFWKKWKEKREQIFLKAEHIARYQLAGASVEGKRVLDVASGSGYGSFYMATQGAIQVVGVELEAEAVKQAQKEFRHAALEYRQDKGEELNHVPESFDVIVSFETIEHIEEDEQFLKKLSEKLLPEGLLFISTPNRHISNPGKSLTDTPDNPFHVREYTTPEFRALLEKYFIIKTGYQQGQYRKQGKFFNKFLRLLKSIALATGLGRASFVRVRDADLTCEPTYSIYVCTTKKS